MPRPRLQRYRDLPRLRKGPIDWREVARIWRGPAIAFVIFAVIVYLLRESVPF